MSHVYHVSFFSCWNIIEKCIATIYSVDIMFGILRLLGLYDFIH